MRKRLPQEKPSSDAFAFIFLAFFIETLFLVIIIAYCSVSFFFERDFMSSQFIGTCDSGLAETMRIVKFGTYEPLIMAYCSLSLLLLLGLLVYMAMVHFNSKAFTQKAKKRMKTQQSNGENYNQKLYLTKQEKYERAIIGLVLRIVALVAEILLLAYISNNYSDLVSAQSCLGSQAGQYKPQLLVILILAAVILFLAILTTLFFINDIKANLKSFFMGENEQEKQQSEKGQSKRVQENLNDFMIHLKIPKNIDFDRESSEGEENRYDRNLSQGPLIQAGANQQLSPIKRQRAQQRQQYFDRNPRESSVQPRMTTSILQDSQRGLFEITERGESFFAGSEEDIERKYQQERGFESARSRESEHPMRSQGRNQIQRQSDHWMKGAGRESARRKKIFDENDQESFKSGMFR